MTSNGTNYYLLLGLFDFENDLVGSSEEDPAVSKAFDDAIEDQQRHWSKLMNNPRKGTEAKQRLDELKRTKRDIGTFLASRQMREDQYAEARNTVTRSITGIITAFAAKGYVTPEDLTTIAEKAKERSGYTVPENVVRKLIPSTVEIREQEVAKGKELSRPQSYTIFNKVAPDLKTYGYRDLYQLLDPSNPRVNATPTDVWRKKAEQAKSRLGSKQDATTTAHKNLYLLCIGKAFKDDAARADYDAYLAYTAMQQVLDEVDMVYDSGTNLPSDMAERYVERIYEGATSHGAKTTRKDAEDHLIWWCRKKNIAYTPAARDGGETAPQTEPCPWCGMLLAPDAHVCPHCGGHVAVACPQCHHGNRADVRYCGECGYPYANLTKATALCDEARASAVSLHFDEADRLLAQADDLWKDLADIRTMHADIDRIRRLVGNLGGELSKAVDDHELAKADRIYQDIARRVPGFEATSIRDTIDAGLSKARNAASQARKGITAQTLPDLLDAYDDCRDLQELNAAFAVFTPKPVTAVTAKALGRDRRVVVSWRAAGTPQSSYIVVRKRGSRPMNIHDGEILAETTATTYVDKSIEPATGYCYAVAAKLGPTMAAPVASPSATALFEVDDLKVTPDESSVHMTWGKPSSGTVQVWRRPDHAPTRPGDGTRVENVIDSGMDDRGLTNDVRCHYTVFVIYRLPDGTLVHSEGIPVEATPSAPAEPMDFLMAQLMPGNVFSLEWETPEGGEARFYATGGAVPWRKGDMVALREIAAKATPLPVTPTGEDTGTFRLIDDAIYHIIGVTVKNDMGVIGETTTVSKRKAVEIKQIQTSGADVIVRFDWPRGCSRVLLSWRTDRFPASAQEKGSNRLNANKPMYDMFQALVVKGLDPHATYYFSLFALIGKGTSSSYSAGSNRMFSLNAMAGIPLPTPGNSSGARGGGAVPRPAAAPRATPGMGSRAVYHVTAHKGTFGLGRVTKAQLDIRTSGPLPATELRAQQGASPMFVTQGVSLAQIPPIDAAGEYSFPLPANLIGKGTFYRLFFADDKAYDTNSLAVTPGMLPQIG